MAANGLTHCVLEMTSHGLAQGRLNGVDIDVAVLTNITHEHLDYHGSFEAYRAAKGRIFEMLNRSDPKIGLPKISVINMDDRHAAYFAAIPSQILMLYSVRPSSPNLTPEIAQNAQAEFIQLISAGQVIQRPADTSFQLFAFPPLKSKSSPNLVTPLIGDFNISNTLAAVAVGIQLNIDLEIIQEGILASQSIPGRMERIVEGQNFTAIVDFAHTPNALENALKACRQMLQPGTRLIAVFGSAGLRDKEKRRLMAEVSARLADFTIFTAEDPRTESLDMILQTMAAGAVSQGGVEGQTFIRVPDRGQALYRACQLAQPGDILIACGKGHEQSMCFGTVEYVWDDRDALRAAIKGAPLKTLPTAQQP
jgi:UDP-N-acetylmuramoyl-L-alanyl-D-glutamate--2,6-diaminopimelate ligase